MQKIIVASQNPVKARAVEEGFARMFPHEEYVIETLAVTSGVSDQPMSDEETYRGAFNRALHASQAMPEADFWVGLEGGIEAKGNEMEAFAWMAIRSRDGRVGKARTSTFFLPSRMVELIREGKELGEADDIVSGRTNSKQAGGTVGFLTGETITRARYYREAVILALIPFRNPELYGD